ncbi:NADH-quinone oxidoreductase subunit 5 family protein [Candidatus Nitrosocosmicus agrestis]|jgi:NADH-quinone oxidoreductase subunit L|uniref:NADH-quinone oxidoreductase subunit 5 family protein n=1 Tax=Candidatus Nitrosocosmicus agrestis TaxID=2563600 RepID=UPI00122E2788|nr:NADH-quinone oxidoreductase subunit L [Candidatus Nitrosocosmicus sp. SS]KAA2279747.1 NADH-quinone oxidoreductase subunit L [Candidatus Nitrosocosmicus sp. SS]KAF0868819.1 NADH-quinone oxidoreductase subunit L [Candidatus Nitrosocosmicus sp. SS]
MVGAIGFEGLGVNAWLIWMLPFIGAAFIPILRNKNEKLKSYVAVGFSLLSAFLALSILPVGLSNGEIHSQIPWFSALNLDAGVLADPLAIIMSNLVAWISAAIFVYSISYMHKEKSLIRYWFFMLFFIGSMQLIVLSDNLLMVFFGWEGVGLASYALIGFWYQDRKKDYVGKEGHTVWGIPMWTSPTHAGIKAFLQNRAGDIMMLSGMFLIFMYSGTFGFRELLTDQTWAHAMMQQNLLVPAAVLIFGGAIGKSAQFPLNEWLLEAMTGPTSVSALIHAATMVKAGVFLVARIGPLFFALSVFNMQQFFEIVAWVGAITAMLLATQALVNPEIKKVLAYSTGSQIGYMMMALGIAGLTTNFIDGYTAGFFHLISHALFKASLFMAAGAILHTVHSRFMTDMGGLRKNMKRTYIFMLLASLSLAGAPLITSGFWSKDAIFASILDSNYEFSSYLFFIAVTVAVMTAFYTFRMVGLVFFGKPSQNIVNMENKGHRIREVNQLMWLPFAVLAVASVVIGLVGFAFEGQLHHVFATYLSSTFGITENGVIPLSEVQDTTGTVEGEGQHEATSGGSEMNPVAVAASVTAFGVGGFLGYLFYIRRSVDPAKINENVVSKGLWRFLYNRWYLNSILYWMGVVIPLGFYRRVNKYFEHLLMYGINPSVQHSMVFMSKVAKMAQSGDVQIYLYVFSAGIIVITMLLLS